VALLSDPDWIVRWCVAEKLGELGHTRAIHPLINLLGDVDAHVRKNASKSLIKFGAKMVPVITRYFASQNPLLRNQVFHVLLSVGPKIIPDLEPTLESESWVVSNRVIDVIWRLGGHQAETALIRALSRPFTQENAIILLGIIKSKRAIPQLIKLFNQPKLRRIVVYTLFRIGEEEAYPVIANALLSKSSSVTSLTAKIVEKIGPQILKYMADILPNTTDKSKEIITLMLKIDREKAIPLIKKSAETNPHVKAVIAQLSPKQNPDTGAKGLLSRFGF